MGESLGADEVKQGLPFVGGVGRILTKLIMEAGFRRQQFFIHNAINCRPPSNKLDSLPPGLVADALVHCSAYWRRTIREVKPKVIIALGNYALQTLVGRSGIMRRRGYVWRVTIEGVDLLVVPTLHPGALVKGEKMRTFWGIVREDIRKAVEYASDPPPPYEENLIIQPTVDDVVRELSPLRLDGGPVWIDLEWLGAALLCVGLAWTERDALCIPFWSNDESKYWAEPDLAVVVEYLYDVLAGPRGKRFHYGGTADIPKLAEVGFVVNNWDGDTGAKHHLLYAELPHKLEFVASTHSTMPFWKDMATQTDEAEEEGK
jgi:DNA polymerase